MGKNNRKANASSDLEEFTKLIYLSIESQKGQIQHFNSVPCIRHATKVLEG